MWKALVRWCEVVGYARAASYLASIGQYEAAKSCMEQYKSLKA